MNLESAKTVVAAIALYWPTPRMGEDVMRLYVGKMAELRTFEIAIAMVDHLINNRESDRRPSIAELRREYFKREKDADPVADITRARHYPSPYDHLPPEDQAALFVKGIRHLRDMGFHAMATRIMEGTDRLGRTDLIEAAQEAGL